jgi:hypothetical protein
MFLNCRTTQLQKYGHLKGLFKFKGEFKKALACESGTQGVLFDEKTEGRKPQDTVPLNDNFQIVEKR